MNITINICDYNFNILTYADYEMWKLKMTGDLYRILQSKIKMDKILISLQGFSQWKKKEEILFIKQGIKNIYKILIFKDKNFYLEQDLKPYFCFICCR